MCVLRSGDTRLRALLGDRELEMPAWVEPAVRALAAGDARAAADLSPWLDQPGRETLVRRLIREGLLEVAPDP